MLAATLAAALGAQAAGGASLLWIALIVALFSAILARQRLAAIASLVIGYAAAVWPPWLIGRAGHAPSASRKRGSRRR